MVRFKDAHPCVSVKAVVADALYGNKEFVNAAHKLFETQVISQLRKDQNITFRGKSINLEDYFNRCNPGVQQKITLRGHKEVTAWVSSARLYVNAHDKKRFVIAIKYDGETDYRFIVASNLSWRTQDILEAYSLRWLVDIGQPYCIHKNVEVTTHRSRPNRLEHAVPTVSAPRAAA
jgi:hypothetical protein